MSKFAQAFFHDIAVKLYDKMFKNQSICPTNFVELTENIMVNEFFTVDQEINAKFEEISSLLALKETDIPVILDKVISFIKLWRDE